jgi:FeS assembly SUF system protein
MDESQTPTSGDVETAEAPSPPSLEDKIVEVLKTCYDPEIPVDIYELGLIYGVKVSPEGEVDIEMTLTSPACPAAGSLPPEVERKVAGLDGVKTAKVNVIWEPVWTPEKMTEAARLQLGMF